MYAHLYFNSGTACGEMIRDITRLITSCTSSTASLSGLEFINTSTSTVTGGNSGWSLHSSSTLPTSGTAVSTSDAYYILQASCTTASKTKYCSIQANCDWTSADVTNSTTSAIGGGATTFNMSSVLDPGTATEMFSAGYTGTSVNYTDVFGIVGTSDFSSGGVRIFADSTRILIHGRDGNQSTILLGNAEFAETSTTTHQSLVPQCNFLVNEMNRANITEPMSFRGQSGSGWFTEQGTRSFFQLSEATYSYNPNFLGKIRATGWMADADNVYGGAYRGHASRSNSTTEGDTTFATTAGYGQSHNPGLLGSASSLSLFGTTVLTTTINDNNAYDNLFGRSNALAYDSSGNVGLALRRIFWEVEPNWNNDVLDISGVSNFWRCAAGLGSDGDTITIGSDVYVYLNMVPAAPESLGAFLIKRT